MTFTDRWLGDCAGFAQIALAAIGDRLGIWSDLSEHGPATSVQLARRMGLSERHVREWLAAMASAHYLDYDEDTRRFALPADHGDVLRASLGALPQLLVSYLKPFERLAETFRTGGGVPQSAYPDATYEAHDRLSADAYQHQLVQQWLPASGIADRLGDGVAVCDVGCGGGLALVTLATAYPRSRFVGYDVFGPNVHRARERARRAGLAERVQFHQLDAAAGLPARFDVITTFDVIHDAVDPHRLMSAIHDGLMAGGTYLCLEPRSDRHAALLYGISMLYSIPTSLAHGGVGLGACGVGEDQLRAMAGNAGFAEVRHVPIADPFNQLYALV